MLRETMDSSMIIEAKTPKVISIFIFSLVMALIIFGFVAIKYKFYLYEHYLGYVIKKDDNYYLTIYVEDNKIPALKDSVIVVDKELVNYKILEISKEYYLLDNNKYHLIVLETKIKEEEKIENNVINLKFKLEETSLAKQIKKGIKLWKN